MLVVSHAREFLNSTCTDIIHLHSRSLTCYKGDYSTFERTMNERVRNAAKAAEAQETKRKHVQVGVPACCLPVCCLGVMPACVLPVCCLGVLPACMLPVWCLGVLPACVLPGCAACVVSVCNLCAACVLRVCALARVRVQTQCGTTWCMAPCGSNVKPECSHAGRAAAGACCACC